MSLFRGSPTPHRGGYERGSEESACSHHACSSDCVRVPTLTLVEDSVMSVDDSIALHEDQISSDRKSYSRQLMRTGNLPRQPVKASSDRKPWLPENRKSLIVDVGCGWGTLLLELRQLGFSNLMGVEGDADLARGTRERCGNNTDGISIVHDDAIEFFEQTDLNFERVLLFHV